ncbi:vWA domain-containing protein [Longimicrobium terrae]|uniref:Ca-activated chloride channel family protein n=1 Tax=Longimicrobium terrae TaxID=1639882 RepID=A0A841H5M4_9BACT|nr:VWA domain-containing protein [Longimicrobium terrae]MBB4639039.1 Ca-activated chloride channel family protein [Longimicrobium terrae]MBB6073360.1 Ca-activated chloride channel family protein [Longimicrobium terrae]NNC28798.1 VWA domain-containing protein [Longimicrobium terrae]
MRFTSYSKYTGNMADALNLQALLDQLSDFLLQSGFAGGEYSHPWWGEFGGDEDDRSMDALKDALLRALLESGQLTPEMIAELRGDGEADDEVRQRIADLLDALIQRMVAEGYLNVSENPQMPGGYTEMDGEGKIDEAKAAAQQVEFSLTGKGVDLLGYRTLRQLLGAMGRSAVGSHETPHLATGVEVEAASRPYEFGDTLNLDIPATLKSALSREDGLRDDGSIDLDYGDLFVNQSEYRSSCATVLMLDTSHSMILYGEDRFTPAKKVALALTHLIRTQFPGDTLKVVTFGDTAEELPASRVAHAQVGPFHTNTAAGLQLARRLLLAQNKDMRQIVMITDGKPSAVTLPDGRVYKNSMGLDQFVLKETFHEVGACRKAGILINTFMLARDPALVAFVNQVSQIARGKAYFTSTMTLGQYIMRDFLKRKTRRAG